ncbi:60S ribosomal protein L27A-3 [Anaeramoeba ignava]|uniref:60S ribosomal protein L27A-3 n=1 Tax=Anaeramoeba ignava TaxID=1746090 RepID=A0A9Q0LD65_ANAIG|nr:60S ribosomal protein L27A-3 [Anaeramoeba ignava]|eukprot:Anaeramoba_ignava/a613043_324.p1 GENE.a613043_324~~a613043_324.p1  ORF type:complete len:149 (+),score=33.19 a613043_324:20-466(+)
MPSRFSKTRKKRGHVVMGYGRVGKHRKHPAGRGKAGGLNHHRIAFDKYHPGYFGKIGMRRYHMLSQRYYCPIINLDKIWTLVPDEVRQKYKDAKETDEVPIIDAYKHGFFKVLGKGKLPKQPMIVRAKFFSLRAEKKIKEVGGVCIRV